MTLKPVIISVIVLGSIILLIAALYLKFVKNSINELSQQRNEVAEVKINIDQQDIVEIDETILNEGNIVILLKLIV